MLLLLLLLPLLKPIEKNLVATFSSRFLLLLLLLLHAPAPATPVAGCDAKIEPLPAANPHGSEGTEKHQNCAQKLPAV